MPSLSPLPAAVDDTAPRESRSARPAWAVYEYLVGLACRMTLLFGVYVLSIGPLYWRWYSAKFVNGSPYLAAFYEPLWILCIRFPWLGDWVDSYVKLWNLWG